MNKNCPRCSNKNIQEGYKYCPICGFKLGTALEVPVQEQSSQIVTNFGNSTVTQSCESITFRIDSKTVSETVTNYLANRDKA